MTNFRFTLPVTGVNFLSDDDDDDGHAIFEALHTAITTTGIPASFEQTQRVPTGHPDVCPCVVSGATNKSGARKPSMMSRFDPGTYRFELRGS